MHVVEGVARVEDVDAFVSDLDRIGERHGVAVQAFDARYVVGHDHLQCAVELARRAFERGDAIARERAVEILLYAAGRRQIDRALAMGVGEGENPVVIVVDGEDEAGAGEDVSSLLAETKSTLGEHDEDLVCEFFDIRDAERSATDATLEDLVCERVALLTVEK